LDHYKSQVDKEKDTKGTSMKRQKVDLNSGKEPMVLDEEVILGDVKKMDYGGKNNKCFHKKQKVLKCKLAQKK